jgi:hypothetical protein
MFRQSLTIVTIVVATASLVLGQQPQRIATDLWSAARQAEFNTVIRGQSPNAIPVDYRRNSELLEIPEYRDLLDEFEETQTEIERLQQQLGSFGIEDHGDHFYFTNDVINNEIYQPEGDMGGGGGGGGGDVATQSQNPVGGLWMMWLQNDMVLYEGPGDGKRIFNTTVFQPVMPVQLTDTWKLINRPVFLFNAFETPSNFEFNPGGSFPPVAPPTDPFSTQAGLGDIALIQWLSNSPPSSKMVTGVGWNWLFPASTKQQDLGTGRLSFGPSAVAMYLGDKVITGGIMQQYFSIDSRQDRTRVSYMDLQYVFRYRLNPMFSVGFAPNMKWDQVTGKVTMPVGIGFDTMTMVKRECKSPLPIRWGAELQYYASHSGGTGRSFDPEWNFRLYVSPIIQAPEWATRGLFGGGSH